MKKLIALVLALALVLASCAVAFAANPSGSLTIKGSEANTEYDFYRILDLDLTDLDDDTTNGYEGYNYKLNDTWKGFWTTGAGKDYLLAENTGSTTLNTIIVDGTLKYINLSESNIVAFTNAAMKYAQDSSNSITYDQKATGDGKDLTVTVGTLGYYLMIPVDASIKTTVSSGSVASLTSTNPTADIKVKAKKPSVEKTDDVVSAEIGQTVTYNIYGTVPNTAGYETYKYIIKDEMTSGLTLNHDVTVKVEGKADALSLTPTYSHDDDKKTDKFEVDIPVMTLQDYVGKAITVTYTAVVNERAVEHTNEKNKVTVKYGHKDSDLQESTPKEEELYSAKIIINKYYEDKDDSSKKLKDATFALINYEGKAYKYTEPSGNVKAKVEWVDVTNGPSASESTAVTDAMIAALGTAGATIKTTNAQGAAEFLGLANGTYYLVETAAPAGYNRLQFPKKVIVKGNEVDPAGMENVAQANQSDFDTKKDEVVDVENNKGTELPSTGGIGTTIFYIVGGLLVIGAAVVLVARRKAQD